ncbi:MAG: hypothetical protein HRT47_05640 [Candidatus Caenarcaniphilales bacterium]|nr:hypothetical protein [Candidatus Caenarcaniphilales bacterium]
MSASTSSFIEDRLSTSIVFIFSFISWSLFVILALVFFALLGPFCDCFSIKLAVSSTFIAILCLSLADSFSKLDNVFSDSETGAKLF